MGKLKYLAIFSNILAMPLNRLDGNYVKTRIIRIEKESSAGLLLIKRGDPDEILLFLKNFRGALDQILRSDSRKVEIDVGPKGKPKREDKGVLKLTACRETREETGLDLWDSIDPNFSEEMHYRFEKRLGDNKFFTRIEKSVLYRIAFVTEEDISRIKLTDAHSGFVRLPLEIAITRSKYESQKRLLRKCMDYLKSMDHGS